MHYNISCTQKAYHIIHIVLNYHNVSYYLQVTISCVSSQQLEFTGIIYKIYASLKSRKKFFGHEIQILRIKMNRFMQKNLLYAQILLRRTSMYNPYSMVPSSILMTIQAFQYHSITNFKISVISSMSLRFIMIQDVSNST